MLRFKHPNRLKGLRFLFILLFFYSSGYTQSKSDEIYKSAKFRFDDGFYSDAVQLFSRVIEMDSTNENAYYFRGRAYLEMNKFDSAIDNFSMSIRLSGRSDPASSEYFLYRGKAYAGNKEYFTAEKDYQTAIRLNPSDPEIYYADSNLKFITMKDKSDAIKDLSTAIALNPDYAPYYVKRAEYKSYQAKYNFSAQEILESAIRDMTFAISLDPGNYEYYRIRSDLYKDRGEPGLAIRDYTEMIDLKPEKFEAYTERGIIRMQNGDYYDAVKDFTTAIDKNPEDEKNFRFRGLCRYNSSDYWGAYQDFSSAITLLGKRIDTIPDRPGNQRILADTYIKRGVSSVSMGNSFNGCADFRKAYELGASKGYNYYQKYCGY